MISMIGKLLGFARTGITEKPGKFSWGAALGIVGGWLGVDTTGALVTWAGFLDRTAEVLRVMAGGG